MKEVFDLVSFDCSKLVTRRYSTSFSMGTSLLGKKIKRHIYNVYGFVRFADEIVDSFHKFNKKDLLDKFENDLFYAIENKISLNPILNSFQFTVNENNIEIELINSFMKSMRLDLHKGLYKTKSEYKKYVYGSADVVGLMCLKVFVKGDIKKYNQLKANAMALGSAFQKVNILRDLKADSEVLKRNRNYQGQIGAALSNGGIIIPLTSSPAVAASISIFSDILGSLAIFSFLP